MTFAMTILLAKTAFLGFFFSALVTPFLPLSLLWRAGMIAILAYIAYCLLVPPVPVSRQDIGYVVDMALIATSVAIVSFAIAIRLLVGGMRGRLTLEGLKVATADPLYRWLDRGTTVFAGGVAGLAVSIQLAFALGGRSGGQALDFGVAALAGLLTLLLPFLCRNRIGLGLVAASTTIALFAVAGSGQPRTIIRSAEAYANGRPWCLALARPGAPVLSSAELGFFSLPRRNGASHLYLVVRDGDGFRPAQWSVRRQEFESLKSLQAWTCHPRKDYAAALESGGIDPRLLAVGPELFSVPPDLYPWASLDSLRIRTSMLTGANEPYPSAADSVSIDFGKPRPRAIEGARPLMDIPVAVDDGAGSLLNDHSLDFAGIDPITGRQVVLQCLMGAYANRNCSATVTTEAAVYSFYLPVEALNDWRQATEKVVALFDAMRVPR